jgi:hypothetical protein
LGWVQLVQGFAHHLYETANSLETLKLQMKGPLGKVKYLKPIVCQSIALRMMGPAYYYYSVVEALLKQDTFFLNVLEPSLFYGLNHLNFTDKRIVILHEATEKYRDLLATEDSSPSDEKALDKDKLGDVLRMVEKVIPDKIAFSEKNFQRAIHLQDRLGQGILLSSDQLYSMEEVHENVNAALEGPKEGRSGYAEIYKSLNLIAESPNTPREIVNAGWIHKLERGPVWLYNTLTGTNFEGFEKLAELIGYQDHLLLKSIETSEVHRVLLCQ